MESCKNVKVEKKKFTKNDMTMGYVVVLRNGERRMAMPVGTSAVLILTNGSTSSEYGKWDYLSSWDDNLTAKLSNFAPHICEAREYEDCVERVRQFDIISVYGHIRGTEHYNECGYISENNRPLLWAREDPKKMTVAEIEKELGYSIEIVAEK